MSWKLYHMDGFLMSLGFNKSVADPNLYHYSVGDESLISITYSEIFIVGNKKDLNYVFEMKDLSMIHYFLNKKYDRGAMRFS